MTIPITGACGSQTRGSHWPSRLAYTAALLFTLASGGTNLLYGWNKGTDLGTSLVWASVSIAVSVVFALSWPALIRSIDQKQWSRAVMVLVALLLTGTYSVSAALGSAMGGRTNAATEEKTVSGNRANTQVAYNAAEAELKGLQSVRPLGELKALIASPPKAKCIIKVQNGSRQTVCTNPVLAALTAELGRAERKVDLEGKLEKATQQLSQMQAPKVANSDAKALAAYLAGLGMDVEVDRLNKLLVLLAVLIMECGGGLALAVGMSLQAAPVSGEAMVSSDGAKVSPQEEPSVSTSVSVTPAASAQSSNSRAAASLHLLSFLERRGGVLVGGQRRMAEALGWSKSWTNCVLHDLAKSGHVQLTTGKTGTVVRQIPCTVGRQSLPAAA